MQIPKLLPWAVVAVGSTSLLAVDTVGAVLLLAGNFADIVGARTHWEALLTMLLFLMHTMLVVLSAMPMEVL